MSNGIEQCCEAESARSAYLNKTLERDRAYLRGVLESMWFRKIKLLSELFGFKRPAPQLPVSFQKINGNGHTKRNQVKETKKGLDANLKIFKVTPSDLVNFNRLRLFDWPKKLYFSLILGRLRKRYRVIDKLYNVFPEGIGSY